MGFSDWLTGTKCAECGQKIQGARFARTVMGTSVWVCLACNEKQKEERRLESERNIALAAKHRQESADAQQKRAAEAAAAIQQRSDADIAEAMSTIFLREYEAFAQKAHDAGGKAAFNHQAAFMYFVAISSYACRLFLGLQFDSARLDRIQETAGRYALAGFIHARVRNTTEAVGDEPIRQKLLSTLVDSYREVSRVHQQNVKHFFEKCDVKNEKMMFDYSSVLCFNWFGKDFVDASTEGKTRMVQCAGLAFIQAMSAGRFLQHQLETLKSSINRDIDFQNPESWCLREESPSPIAGQPSFRYYDPATPQYALLVSVGAPLSRPETPEALLRRILPAVAPDAVPVSLGPERAFAHYRTSIPENGQPKDDHHWVLADSRGGSGTRHALFTLSVLAVRADRCTTEALVASLEERIQQTRFLV